MKDDLLIRFIDGNTTPEETEQVLNELSQDGGAAKEWMQMVQGARMAGTKPAQDILPDDFIAKTLAKNTEHRNRGGRVISLPWIIGSITAVAASVAIVATVFINSDKNGEYDDIMAESSDTTEYVETADSVMTKEVVDVKDIAHESVAETIKSETIEQDEEVSMDLKNPKVIRRGADATASNIELPDPPSFEMVKPAKTPYRVRVMNPDKEFVFEWKASETASARLVISDREGQILIDMEAEEEGRCGIVAAELVDKGVLNWTIDAIFPDGSQIRKTGQVELVSVKK